MRCPDCNKFVGYDEADPEVNSLEVDDEGQVSAEVRIVNCCQDCGNELKEANFQFETDHADDVKEHVGEGHGLEIEEESCERTSRSGNFKNGVFIPGGGRYAKTFYGVSLGYAIKCECEKLDLHGTLEDEEQASGMEELV